jgi:hypothetical protein
MPISLWSHAKLDKESYFAAMADDGSAISKKWIRRLLAEMRLRRANGVSFENFELLASRENASDRTAPTRVA